MATSLPKAFRPKPKSKTQQILNKVRYVKHHKDGTSTIVRDNYHNSSQTWWDMQKQILKRDDHRCRGTIVKAGQRVRCTHAAPDYRLEVHHILELSHGGKTIPANLITLCSICHRKKHSHDF